MPPPMPPPMPPMLAPPPADAPGWPSTITSCSAACRRARAVVRLAACAITAPTSISPPAASAQTLAASLPVERRSSSDHGPTRAHALPPRAWGGDALRDAPPLRAGWLAVWRATPAAGRTCTPPPPPPRTAAVATTAAPPAPAVAACRALRSSVGPPTPPNDSTSGWLCGSCAEAAVPASRVA
eukprot:7183592-Prymnesium_polylepis.1